MLASGRTVCFATDILAYILDSTAKLKASGTIKDNCPICEDGRRLPKGITFRSQGPVTEPRDFVSSLLISEPERKRRIALLCRYLGHIQNMDLSRMPLYDGLNAFAATESMHAEDSCGYEFPVLVYYAVGLEKSGLVVPFLFPRRVDLEMGPEHGGAFLVRTNNSHAEAHELPRKSRQNNPNDPKAVRLLVTKGHKRSRDFP